ncbi:MAG: BlaI/MecI/CopY family transcriptional regulator [Planctomycetaceae bacterium]|nr:BlaI/MecI/CopY family transcriptional regulator [Planctomycetaceae bacterium]
MEIIFSANGVTVHDVCARLDGRPTPMAVRRMLAILMEKGQLRRHKAGREYVYLPAQSRTRAGIKALRQVLSTFFNDSIGTALATHLEHPGTTISTEELQRLESLVQELSERKDQA